MTTPNNEVSLRTHYSTGMPFSSATGMSAGICLFPFVSYKCSRVYECHRWGSKNKPFVKWVCHFGCVSEVRINITYQHKPNQTKMITLCCFKMSWRATKFALKITPPVWEEMLSMCAFSSHQWGFLFLLERGKFIPKLTSAIHLNKVCFIQLWRSSLCDGVRVGRVRFKMGPYCPHTRTPLHFVKCFVKCNERAQTLLPHLCSCWCGCCQAV